MKSDKTIKIDRAWSIPTKNTFKIPAIKRLLDEELELYVPDGIVIDPFAGFNSPALWTNDINPETPTTFHMEAVDFLSLYADDYADCVLFDPPYSAEQVIECYKELNLPPPDVSQHIFWTKVKREISRIVKPDGKVISFGWNTNGVGTGTGFKHERILIVSHGYWYNDTLVTVSRKPVKFVV